MKEDINVLKNGWLTDNVKPPRVPLQLSVLMFQQIIAFWEEYGDQFLYAASCKRISN